MYEFQSFQNKPCIPEPFLTMAAALRKTPRFPLCHRRFTALAAAADDAADLPAAAADPVGFRRLLIRLKAAIRSETDPDRVVELFESSSGIPHFHHDRFVYQISVSKLSHARRPDLIERILQPQLSAPSAPKSEGFLLRLMSLYTSSNMPDHAIRVFHTIASRSPIPTLTDRPLSALLTAYLKTGNFDAVVDSFNRIPKELSITPGVVPHNILLKALSKKDDFLAARNLLDEMSQKELANIVSYNLLLEGYLAKGDEAGFEEILQEISSKGVEANAVTYRLRAAMYCRKTEYSKAEELLDVMELKKVTPSIVMFKTMILGFCKEGNVGAAFRVFKRLKNVKKTDGDNSLVLDAEAHHALLKGLVKGGKFGSAFLVCKDSLTHRMFPPFKVMKKLVEGLRKNSKVDEAMSIMNRMNKGLSGEALVAWKKFEGEDNYNCKIMELCQNSESKKAEELLDVMVSEGIEPTRDSFKTIINGFCKEGNAASAMLVFERMKGMERKTSNNKLTLDSDTYIALMRGLVEQGDLTSALEVCKECLNRKLTPPIEIVKHLIEDLTGNSKVDEAKDLAEKMRQTGKGHDLDKWKKLEGELSLEVP